MCRLRTNTLAEFGILNQRHAVKAKHPITFYMRNNLCITTSGNVSPVSFMGAVMSLGADRILFATDYPFDLGPAFLQNLESGIPSKADLEKVYHGNATRVFKLGETLWQELDTCNDK